MLLPIERALCLCAISSLIAMTSCTTRSAPNEHGVIHVSTLIPDHSHDESKFADGVVLTHGDPDVTQWAQVKYNNGEEVTVRSGGGLGSGLSTGEAFDAACKNHSNCPYATYRLRTYGIAPLDGQDWMDTNLWLLVGFFTYSDADKIKYETCSNGEFYSAHDLKTLMDVLDKLKRDPAAESDADVRKYLLSDDAIERHMPVCNWRQRVELDKAYPHPTTPIKVAIFPASNHRPTYVEVADAKGGKVEIYVDEAKNRLDKFVFISSKGSATLRPVYEGNDCPTYERCEHFVLGPEKKPDRLDIHSLDGEPLIQSRLFEVDDTVAGLKVYDGCAGGRLYTGKNRQEIEREIEEAIANPAPPPKTGAPMMGTPETAESGDVVIPDTFCDWAFRRQQAEAMQKSNASQ